MKKKIIIITSLLILFGLLMIYSSTYVIADYKFNNKFYFLEHQALFTIIGFILIFIIQKIDYNFFYKNANVFLFITTFLLIIVLIPGIGIVRNGSRSWFGIGPFGIQPSELSKLSLIIFTAKYLSKYDKKMNITKEYSFPIFFIILINFILILIEPDFGSGIILVISLIALIFTSNIKLKFFYKLGFIGLLGLVILILIAPYRIMRIISFFNPWADPLGSGYQSIMSLYAISPSNLFGVGLGNSIQKHFYLPEPGTDFIFAIALEELGIISIFFIIILYLFLTKIIIKYSLEENNLFKKYLSLGLYLQLVIQTLLNISIVVGLLPVTGITLPFISYGGSSLLISLTSIGIIINLIKKE